MIVGCFVGDFLGGSCNLAQFFGVVHWFLVWVCSSTVPVLVMMLVHPRSWNPSERLSNDLYCIGFYLDGDCRWCWVFVLSLHWPARRVILPTGDLTPGKAHHHQDDCCILRILDLPPMRTQTLNLFHQAGGGGQRLDPRYTFFVDTFTNQNFLSIPLILQR